MIQERFWHLFMHVIFDEPLQFPLFYSAEQRSLLSKTTQPAQQSLSHTTEWVYAGVIHATVAANSIWTLFDDVMNI